MNEALVVILALLWALVLLPGAIRSRRSSPRSTVGGFEHAMDVLAHHRGSKGRELLVPNDANRIVSGRSVRRGVLARRRRVFTSLLGVTATAFVLAVLLGGPLWLVFLASGTGLGAYVVLLLNLKAQRQQAARVVRAFPRDEDRDGQVASEPELARAAGGGQAYAPGSEAYASGGQHYGGLQVATRPDEPWESPGGVRIRRWDA